MRAMKSTILTVAAAALLVIPTLRAEDKPADKPAGDKPAGDKPAGERPPGGRPGGGRTMSPEDRLKFMTERLGLTQEQQDKIKAIYAKNADKFKAMREKGFQNLTDDEKKEMGELRKAEMEEVSSVLTDEQKKKLAEGRRGGPGGPGGEGRRRPDGDKPGEKPEAK